MADFSLILSGNEFKRVRTAAACGKSVHAYMLQGPDGIGKRSFALLLSAAVLHEPLSLIALLGAALIIGSALVSELAPEKKAA